MAMEGSELTTRNRTGQAGNQEADPKVLMSSKPLHRFVQKEPRSLGIVILILGCAELTMGFHLADESLNNSTRIYIPFWQGALFVVCGILSIYTEIHPSKKMVTVCLAMYVVSLLGVVVSIGFRIHFFTYSRYFWHIGYSKDFEWGYNRLVQLLGVESLLFISSLCVSVLLIFLCAIARLALKSTHTQVIVQCIPAPQRSDTTPN